jgi:hypothetical protein
MTAAAAGDINMASSNQRTANHPAVQEKHVKKRQSNSEGTNPIMQLPTKHMHMPCRPDSKHMLWQSCITAAAAGQQPHLALPVSRGTGWVVVDINTQ